MKKAIHPEVVNAAAEMLKIEPDALLEAIRLSSPKSYTRAQAAKFLQLSEMTISRMIRRGDLPCFRAGLRGIRIPADAIENLTSIKDEVEK